MTLAINASANGEMKDGWLILEDFESQPTLITHNFQPGNGQTAVLTYTQDPKGINGTSLDVSGTSWQEIVEIDVTLPAGKTIADYAQIAFDYYVVKVNYKNIKVMVDDKELYYSSNYGNATSTGKWIEFSTTIPETMTSSNNFKLRFGVDSGESGSQYYYDNVRLLPKADVSGDSQNGTLNGDIFMVEDFEKSIKGSNYTVLGGTKASVADNPSGTGSVIKVANSSYSSFPQFEVKLPEGKTLANVRNVLFDIYVPTSLSTQPSDPTFKQRRIAINGTEVYYDVKEGTTTEDYPDNGAADKWATVTLDINALDNVTDAMKALSEFNLAVGIHDNAITYYMDNVRLQLADPSVAPEPEMILMTTLDYISSMSPKNASYTTIVECGENTVYTNTSTIKKLSVVSKSYATLYCNDVEIDKPQIRDSRNTLTDFIFEVADNITLPGEYKIVFPAECITFTKKDGSTFKNPEMYYTWTLVEKPHKGTKDDPFEDLSFFFDIAGKSNYNFTIHPDYQDFEYDLWYKVYVVGWVDNDMQAHFDCDNVPTSHYATLLADDVNVKDPAKCMWATTRTGANLALEGEHGKDTFHKRFLASNSTVGNYERKGVSFVRGSISKANKTEITGSSQSAIDSIVTDGTPSTVTVYNLQGMQLLRDAAPESLSALPSGLYIVNGRKMVIK